MCGRIAVAILWVLMVARYRHAATMREKCKPHGTRGRFVRLCCFEWNWINQKALLVFVSSLSSQWCHHCRYILCVYVWRVGHAGGYLGCVCEFRELFCFRFAMLGALQAHNKWRELNFEDIYARRNGFYAPEDISFWWKCWCHMEEDSTLLILVV